MKALGRYIHEGPIKPVQQPARPYQDLQPGIQAMAQEVSDWWAKLWAPAGQDCYPLDYWLVAFGTFTLWPDTSDDHDHAQRYHSPGASRQSPWRGLLVLPKSQTLAQPASWSLALCPSRR